jgi:hypothetical protein
MFSALIRVKDWDRGMDTACLLPFFAFLQGRFLICKRTLIVSAPLMKKEEFFNENNG